MTTEVTSPDDMLSSKEACAYVGLSLPTLLELVRKFRVPRMEIGRRKIGGRTVPSKVKYRRRELDRMIERASKQMR